MLFDPIRVVSRPKKNGLATHFGVHFPGGLVYDYTADEGFRQITLQEFSDGMSVTTVREIPWHMATIIRARLNEVSRNPRKYHLLEWNCETFAEWLTSGVPKSAQVIAAVTLLGAFAVLVLMARG